MEIINSHSKQNKKYKQNHFPSYFNHTYIEKYKQHKTLHEGSSFFNAIADFHLAFTERGTIFKSKIYFGEDDTSWWSWAKNGYDIKLDIDLYCGFWYILKGLTFFSPETPTTYIASTRLFLFLRSALPNYTYWYR